MGSDKLHSLLLDNLNASVLLVDQELSVVYVNSAAESLLQIGSSRLIGSKIVIYSLIIILVRILSQMHCYLVTHIHDVMSSSK